MAKLSRWAIFLRAFVITLAVGNSGRLGAAGQAELNAWQTATRLDSIAAYYRYLSQYPSGEFVEQAIEALVRHGAIDRAAPGRQIPPLGRGINRAVPERDDPQLGRGIDRDPY